jgi:2-succinyl-5-enolpyruvyl-6-hydroxy-3-cyclohexene-1-carboxylate synthase
VAGAVEVEAEPVFALAEAAGWPVLAEPASNLRRGRLALSAHDALLRAKGFAEAQAADFVLRMGPLGTSKAVSGWVASAGRRVLVDADAAPLDAERRPSEIVRADPATLCGELAELIEARGPSPWLETWLDADRRARRAIDDELDRIGAPSEPGAARDLTAGLPDGATLVVASSMPVRDIDWFMRPREGVRVLANRGANGIDGFVSTTIGVALSSHGPVVALCGDLSLLHDSNGLLPRGRGRANAVFVVLNNDGGGVFSFLPQASEERFEELFATPQGIDLEVLARLHGCGYCRVTDRPSLVPAVLRALDDPGVHLVEVRTERAENLELHNRLWQAAARTAR